MMKAFLIAMGITMCVVGAEFLAVEKLILSTGEQTEERTGIGFFVESQQPRGKEFRPREWHPWALLSTGAVVILYGTTLQQKLGS
jgi:hypothetical protein